MSDPTQIEPTDPAPNWKLEHLKLVRSVIDGPPHQQIGAYHLLERIGSGGMGEVWRGERREPMHQIVAVKIVKRGLDTAEVIGRFESERQALARMNHPNIAGVLDAGTTESGRPYFVMEYVPGEPITRFADNNKLSIRDRLTLFIDVCDAIAHAHQKAIIHRDIKSSNVLGYVQDGKPTVKVIDFGIAKALTGERLTDRTTLTQLGQAIGTLDSMPPEQADGSPDIDTRTDVYALGVLLYELLTGAKPFDSAALARASEIEVRRIIREVDPPRPSARLTTLASETATRAAAARGAQPRELARELRTELEWIPLKAMRKERDRRYTSALELADDIRRYFDGRPLLAGPESRSYRLRKFVRRNVRGMVALAAMLLLLMAGVTATAWQAIRATRALNELKRANAGTEAVNNFLREDLLKSANPEITRGEDLTVKNALDTAAQKVGERFTDQPLIEASIRGTIAETYDALGHAELGLPHARKAVEIFLAEYGEDDIRTIGYINALVQLLQSCGDYGEAEQLAIKSANAARQFIDDYPETVVTAISNLGHGLHFQGRPTDAEPYYREALELSIRKFGPEHSHAMIATNNLAGVLNSLGRDAEAEPLYQHAYDVMARAHGRDHPDVLIQASNLAHSMEAQGKLEAAEALNRETLALSRRVFGASHPNTIGPMRNLAKVLAGLDRLEEAESLYREALSLSRSARGDNHPEAVGILHSLASMLRQKGRSSEAEPLLREVVSRLQDSRGEGHPHTVIATSDLAAALFAQKKYSEAENFAERAWKHAKPDSMTPTDLGKIALMYGTCLLELERCGESEKPLLQAYELLKSAPVEGKAAVRSLLPKIVRMYEKTDRPAEAAKWRAMIDPSDAATRPSAATRSVATQPTTAP